MDLPRVAACAAIVGLFWAVPTSSAQAAHTQSTALRCPVASTTLVPAVDEPFQPAPDALIACVGSDELFGADLTHWLAVTESPLSFGFDPNRALAAAFDFLIGATWAFGEARERGIDVPRAAVRRRYVGYKRESFHTAHAFREFLRQSRLTVPDLMYLVRLEMTEQHVLAAAAGRGTARTRRQRLRRYLRHYRAEWIARTQCTSEYAQPRCGSTFPVTPSKKKRGRPVTPLLSGTGLGPGEPQVAGPVVGSATAGVAIPAAMPANPMSR